MKISLAIATAMISSCAFAQGDLLKELDQVQDSVITYSAATFKGTRIINGHSVETVGKKQYGLHHFAPVRGGKFGSQ